MRAAAARVGTALAVCALAGLALLAVSADAAPRIALTTQPDVPFPVRVYAVSLPGGGAPKKVTVTENGHKVDASVVPIGSKATPFSAIVMLDASLTMVGKPFVAARTAAKILIDNKPARSELALYGFAARPFAVQDFSKDKRTLTDLVTSLKIRYGTAMWNTVIVASRRLQTRDASAKAIVILTDGRRDTTATPVGRAVRAAQTAGARVFVVIAGPGGALQRKRLNRLATATGGGVIKVDSIPQLRRAFAQVSRTLSDQYLVSYASAYKKPGRKVHVRMRIDGATTATSYVVPHPPVIETKKTSFVFTARGRGLIVSSFILIPTILLAALAYRARRGDGHLRERTR